MNPSVQLFAKQQGLTGPEYSQYLQLDLYESEPIKLTKSIQGLENPEKTTSGYSQTFRVPHTAANGTYFKAVFNVNVEDFDASLKADAFINVNGSYFTSGNIRLTNIFRNGREGKIEYQIIFMGETSNFGSIVGPRDLSELNLNDYTHNLDYTSVTNSWTGNLFNGDIVYPLAEYGYSYDDDKIPQQPTLSVFNATTSQRGFTDITNALLPEQLRPAIRVKRVWDRIFEEAGFTYESNFLGQIGATASNFFGNIYMVSTNEASPIFPDLNEFNSNFVLAGINVLDSRGSTVGVSEQIRVTKIFKDPNNAIKTPPNFAGSFYQAPSDAQPYVFFLKDIFSLYVWNTTQLANSNVPVFIDFIKNGSILSTQVAYSWMPIPGQAFGQGYLANTNGGTIGGVPIDYNVIQATPSLRSFTFSANGTTDDEFTFRIRILPQFIQQLKIQSGLFNGDGPPDVSPSGMLPTQYKQLDLIKGINDRFKLVWEPDPDNPKKFYIEPWNDWILGGQQRDWTDKLDESMDVDITPLFTTQQREIFYQDSKEGDIYNVLYENQQKQIFGELQFDSKLEVLKGVKNINSFFAPTPLAPIPGDNSFIIPHFAKDTETERQPIQVKPRLLFYNGQQQSRTWYLDNNGTAEAQTTYALMSQFSLYPFNENAFDLNWSNSEQYWDELVVGFNGRTDNTAWRQYWKTWSDYTYSPYSRKMVATFVLNAEDVQTLRYNDKIYVKDAWWLVQEIADYVLGTYAKCKVTLIKLANNVGFGLNQPGIDQGKYYQITGVCFAGGFIEPSVCTACCCEGVNNVTVWSESETLDTSFALYADNGGNIPAPAGYYSDGTLAYEVDSFGTILTVSLCSGCVCGPGPLQSAEVNFSTNLCTICCSETFPVTIYHNGATGAALTTATKAYSGATGGSLTSGTWYRESGTNEAVQIGDDGNTILQIGACEVCDCNELPIEFTDALVFGGTGATTLKEICCVEFTATLPESTVYATDVIYGVATGYFYDPYSLSPVSPGDTASLVTGVDNPNKWVQVSDGAVEIYGICVTGAAKLTACDRTEHVRSIFDPIGGTASATFSYYLSGVDLEGNPTAQELTGQVTLSGSTTQDSYNAFYSIPSYMNMEWDVPGGIGEVQVKVFANEGDPLPIYDTGPGQPLAGTTPIFGPFGSSPTGGSLGTTWTTEITWNPIP